MGLLRGHVWIFVIHLVTQSLFRRILADLITSMYRTSTNTHTNVSHCYWEISHGFDFRKNITTPFPSHANLLITHYFKENRTKLFRVRHNLALTEGRYFCCWINDMDMCPWPGTKRRRAGSPGHYYAKIAKVDHDPGLMTGVVGEARIAGDLGAKLVQGKLFPKFQNGCPWPGTNDEDTWRGKLGSWRRAG